MVQDRARLHAEADPPRETDAARLCVSPRRVTLGLTVIALLLTLIGLAAGNLPGDRGRPFLMATFRRLFHLNGEGNVAVWFSASLLLLCSLLLAVTAGHARQTRGGYTWHWAVLALLFLLLSLDEAARLHEPISLALRLRLGTRGALVHTWVIP